MPLEIGSYVDPGVYIGEVIPPSGVNVATTPLQLGVIGVGSREKTITNEAVQRGLVSGEILTVQSYTGAGASSSTITSIGSGVFQLALSAALPDPASRGIVGQTLTITGAVNPGNNGNFLIVDRPTTTEINYINSLGVVETSSAVTFSVSPYAVLANRSDDTIQNTTVFRAGTALSDTFVSYQARYVQGDVTSARTFAGGSDAMVLMMDGHTPITILFTNNGSGTITVTQVGDTQFDVTYGTPAGTTPVAEVALAINAVLTSSGAAALGYGAGYANVATTALGGGLRVISPVTTPNGDVEVLPPISGDLNIGSGSRLFTTYVAPGGIKAASVVGITRTVYTASSVYTADYINIDSAEDELAQAVLGNTVTGISNVGSFIGASNFVQGVDYLLDNGNIDWGVAGAPPDTFATYPLSATTPQSASAPIGYNLKGAAVSGASGTSGTIATTGDAAIFQLTAAAGTPFAGVTPGQLIVIGLSTTPANDGAYLITSVTSSTVLTYRNTNGSADAANASLTYAVFGALNTLRLSFDGKAPVNVNLLLTSPTTTVTNPILGYTYDVEPATDNSGATFAVPASTLAANINAVVGSTAAYGPTYSGVAVARTLTGGTFLQLTTPTDGVAGSVGILVPTSGSANTTLFGLQASQTITAVGTGGAPTYGSIYFATYTIVRPTTDYNTMKRFFSVDQARADLGATTAQNPLMIAVELAFTNQCPSIVVVQVNDSAAPGSPTRAEFDDAIAATSQQDLVTELVVLSTDLAVQIDVRNNIEFESSPTQKDYRRGWFGMAVGTGVGDKDTPGSYVYEATRVLQVSPDSPGRGRYMLVTAPQIAGVTRTITLSDGSSQTLTLDSTYLAVAAAALKTSFASPADTLARKSVSGFDVNTVTVPWLKVERGLMASQGCMVVTFQAGNFTILDPVTTEVGGGGLAAFSYDSTSSQKDNVSRKIEQALNDNLVGVVPTDLADFLVDIKILVADVLAGEIGAGSIAPYRNSNGTSRAIDLQTDIEVQQDPNDPTKYFFNYFFFLRYPALRLLGQFSVDRAFFSSAAA